MALTIINIGGVSLSGDPAFPPCGLAVDYSVVIPSVGFVMQNSANNIDATLSSAQIKINVRDQVKQLIADVGRPVPANNEIVIFGGPA